MFTFSSDIEFVPSVSNKILGSAPKQTNKQNVDLITVLAKMLQKKGQAIAPLW